MSSDGLTTCVQEQKGEPGLNVTENNKCDEAKTIEEDKSLIKKHSIETLQDQLRLAKEENESQKRKMEDQLTLFEKEKQAWIAREKELLNRNLNIETCPDAGKETNPGQNEKFANLELNYKTNMEELKSVKEQFQKAQERLATLESSSSDTGNKTSGKKETKGQSDKKQQQDNSPSNEESLRRENEKLRTALHTAVERLKGKTIQAVSVEKQNVQLRAQVASLKEVTGITKDLLGIRNAEVEHLRADMDAIEAKVKSEKDERATAIARVEIATRLNAELKHQYEIQLNTFKQLKSKYEEKVDLLCKENRRLVAEANAEGRPEIPIDVGPLIIDEEEAPQH